jgi:hypothetical protein
MDEQHLTDEMVEQWREGCRLLATMTPEEYRTMRGAKWGRFAKIDIALTRKLVSPGGPSLFDSDLDHGPCHARPETSDAFYWPTAQTWRKALTEASGEVPRDLSFVYSDEYRARLGLGDDEWDDE